MAHITRATRAALATCAGQRRAAWLLTALAIALDALIVGAHVLQRHLGYHSEAFDLGNMDQAVWNTLHGHLLRFTNRGIDWYGPPTRLAVHVEPILVLVAPLYLLHSGAETLLVLQTVALALGAIPLLALALRRLPDAPLLGVCFVLAYLLAPEILGEALYDFHPVALATPLLLAAFWALDARRYGWLLLAGVLAALCKEDVALALVPLGAFIALRRGRPRLGWGLALGAAAWTALCFFVIIPHFNGGASASGNAFWYRYTDLGRTPKNAVRNIVTDPLLLLGVVFAPGKLAYLGRLALTGGALGVFAPWWWLVAAPELAINLLSTQEAQFSAFYQYNAMLLPVLLVAGIHGVAGRVAARAPAADVAAPPAAHGRRAQAWLARQTARVAGWWNGQLARLPLRRALIYPLVAGWLLLATGINLLLIQPKLSGFWHAGDGPAPDQARIAALLARIPASAVVAATDTLDPHLSDRATIYLLPDPQAYQAEYVAVDLPDVPPTLRPAETAMVQRMEASRHYVTLGTAGAVVVLRRVGAPLPPS
ncbi:MAG TPA: DUF2079 domain-containing protein [Ktedonobacterales bacterium]|nr:DUF2079 domain-containing protein [Ktedonobacterales bacterium]